MNPQEAESAYPPREHETGVVAAAIPGDGTGGAPAAPTEAALIARMATGDESALSVLYDRWSNSLYSVIVQIVRDRDESEDVLEEAFWQAWKSAANYDPARGTTATWLITIARSRALDRLRARQRLREMPFDADVRVQEALATDDPAADAELSERRKALGTALADLPEDQRVPLVMGYFGGFTQTEIADRTGQPLGTIKTRMRLGMRKLRERLQPLAEKHG